MVDHIEGLGIGSGNMAVHGSRFGVRYLVTCGGNLGMLVKPLPAILWTAAGDSYLASIKKGGSTLADRNVEGAIREQMPGISSDDAANNSNDTTSDCLSSSALIVKSPVLACDGTRLTTNDFYVSALAEVSSGSTSNSFNEP